MEIDAGQGYTGVWDDSANGVSSTEIGQVMAQRLVKTIQATQVRSIGRTQDAAELSVEEVSRLTSIAERHRADITLRRAGLSPREIGSLEFVRWRVARQREGRA
jgi:hypothetical protein